MVAVRFASLLTARKCGRRRARAAGAAETPARRRPPRPRGAAGEDAEAAAGPRRGLAEDPGHGMQWLKEGFESLEESTRPKEGAEYRALVFMDKVQELTTHPFRAHLPIPGNIYRYRAIARFIACSDGTNGPICRVKARPSVWAGIMITMAIQIFAPIVLLIWAVYKIDKVEGHWWGLQGWRYDSGSDVFGVSYVTQRILAIMFLLLFTINGHYALQYDRDVSEKMYRLVRAFDKVATWYPYDSNTGFGYKSPPECWLWIDAAVNSYVVVMLSVCMFLVFVLAPSEGGPKDIVFDAFGIAFLYKLDDTYGEMSFLDELWDEDLIGDMYGRLLEDDELLDDIRLKQSTTCTANDVIQCAIWVMKALTFILPVAFVFFQGRPVELNQGRQEMLGPPPAEMEWNQGQQAWPGPPR